MSNSHNLNRMSWAINRLWDLDVNTNDIGLSETLVSVMGVLRSIKEDMIKEREERIAKMFADVLINARDSSPLVQSGRAGTGRQT